MLGPKHHHHQQQKICARTCSSSSSSRQATAAGRSGSLHPYASSQHELDQTLSLS
jgi:hypothetical protein